LNKVKILKNKYDHKVTLQQKRLSQPPIQPANFEEDIDQRRMRAKSNAIM
jgi:hypothetical protein